MTTAEIRQAFLDFFRSKGHEIVPSASIVIKNDPTLLFTNAGMNQFKDYFLANKTAPYQRVADTQKCLRVSGKHNDLEEVGVDTYHHTMFEMLGNWSFGDPARPAGGYFKKEAIAWSWELLTEIYHIPKDRLYVTVFEGDAAENLPRDEEAFTEWRSKVEENRIVPGNKKDNFWEMGDTGPCGPCTEIHVDCRSDEERKQQEGKNLVNKDHPQVIEIWNNVFIQFNRLKNGSLEPLPSKHVDTGMGLERLVRVLQQKQSNYDTDLFSGTIQLTGSITGKTYGGSDSKPDIAFRVIADHIRAIAFTIADAQLPSNTGAGYVIRRILRRAARYYYSYLDYRQPLLFQLIPLLADQFKNVFPELYQQADFVSKVIREEEDAFLRTLEKGISRFENFIINDDVLVSAPSNEVMSEIHDLRDKKIIHGFFAFELFDTFGFPLDLTSLMAREIGWEVDVTGFEKYMQQQKNRSRAAGAIDTEDWIVLEEAPTTFTGYDSLEAKTKITRYRSVNTKGKKGYQLVLDTTPFYAESGGQIGDTGKLIFSNEEVMVTDTKKENELIVHFTDTLPPVSEEALAKVNSAARKATAVHHSATHLLHAALRQVLGTHVSQKGSLVSTGYLRFDFSHFTKVTPDELRQIEAVVNEKIRQNIPVAIKQMSKEEALALGAMALFGEKYGDRVRVVTIDPKYSIELCGGTHVNATGELGFFKITGESAVAAGVRRIEAVSGKAAEEFINEQLQQLQEIREQLKNPKDVIKALESIHTENTVLKKQLEVQEVKELQGIRKRLLERIQPVHGVNFIGEIVDVSNADALKKLCYDVKTGLSNFLIVLAAGIDGKAHVAVCIDEALSAEKNISAPLIIKEHIAPLIRGGGGGQKTLATAGGQDSTKLQLVVDKVRALVANG